MQCPKCRYEAPGDVRFCGRCGTPLAPGREPFDPDRTETMAFACGELAEGSLFAGRYLVVEELGRGGMGRVFRVLDTKVDEDVALKFINPDIAADAKAVERFRTELRITRRITHRNVCRMYDLGSDGGSLFITMEYIPGEDLDAMLRRLGRLPVEKAYVIARQVAQGLAEVHRLGVVHRDLKPKNIMIDREGNARIMDFGLARTPQGVKLTEAGHVVGTPSFMSPEQLNGEAVDPRSDIFALGVILYDMLTGRLPFDAATTLTLALQHKTHRPAPPRALNPRVSEELGRIVMKCLAIGRKDRYPGAEDLLADLDKAGEAFDTYDVHVPGRTRKGAAAGPLRRPRIGALAGAGIVLALAVTGLAVKAVLERPRTEAVPPPVVRETVMDAAARSEEPALSVPVAFVTVPSRATVFVDGVEMGLSDDTFILTPGPHEVRVRKPGYRELVATLVAEPGGTGPPRAEYRLAPLPPALGTLAVSSEPSEADVFLDGSATPAGKTPFVRELPAGKVTVRISADGHEDRTDVVELRAGERSSLSRALTPRDGIVDIRSEPPGAEVYSGDFFLGRTPLRRPFAPGIYRLRIAMKDRGERKEVITVNPGETLGPLTYAFFKPAAAAAATYYLKVTSSPPGAAVTIDGVLQKEPTPCVCELHAAEVRIRVERTGYLSGEETVALRPLPAHNEKSFTLKKTG